MLSKKYIPVLLLILVMAFAWSFSVFADETDGDEQTVETGETEQSPEEGSSVIVTNDIMKIWEQTETDELSGPSLLAALIGQPPADPDATGIASAVIGRWDNGEVDLPGDIDSTDQDVAFYLAFLAQIQAQAQAQAQAAVSVTPLDTTPVTDAEGRELIPLGTFAVTKYCPCSICSGGSGSGITASGKRARANHTIAADTRLYPFGTQLMINGIIYTVEDTGGAIRGNIVDIFVNDHSEAVSYGTHYADVYLVK